MTEGKEDKCISASTSKMTDDPEDKKDTDIAVHDEDDELSGEDQSESSEEEGSDETDEDGDSNVDDEDTEEEDETETEEVDDEDVDEGDTSKNEEQSLATSSSMEKCPICLNSMALGQDIGTPDSCSNLHNFCLDCIEEWSANVSTCPVDRKPFTIILVKRDLGGAVIEKIAVKNRSLVLTHDQHEMEALDDLTFCEICGRCDHEDRLLLCDGCDFGYHCDCLSPPLEEVPVEEWFCPDCFRNLFGSPETSTARQELNRLSRVRRGGRVIARTRALEAVRSRIERRRTAVLSESEPETISLPVASSSSNARKRATPVKRTVKRRTTKRKTTKRRRTTKRKTTRTTKTGKKRKTRRRKRRRKTTKRKSRRSLASSKRLPAPPTARDRIWEKLGMERKKALGPHSLPVIRKIDITSKGVTACSGKSHWSRNDLPALSLTGSGMNSFGAVPLSSVIEEEEMDYAFGGDSVMASRSSTVSTHSAILSSKSLPRNPDILSSILAGQEILHADSDRVVLTREGQLKLNKPTSSPARKRAAGSNDKSGTSSSEQKPRSSTANGNSESQQSKNATTSSTYEGRSSTSISPDRHQEEFMISKPTPSFCNSDIPLKKRKYDMDKVQQTPSSDIFSDIEPEQPEASSDLPINETPEQKHQIDHDGQQDLEAKVIPALDDEKTNESSKIFDNDFTDTKFFPKKAIEIKLQYLQDNKSQNSRTSDIKEYPQSHLKSCPDSKTESINVPLNDIPNPPEIVVHETSPITSPEKLSQDVVELDNPDAVIVKRCRHGKIKRMESVKKEEELVDLTNEDEPTSPSRRRDNNSVRSRLSSMVLKTETVSSKKSSHSSSRDQSSRSRRSPHRESRSYRDDSSRREDSKSDRHRSRGTSSREESRWKHDKYDDRSRSRKSSEKYSSSSRDRHHRDRAQSPRRRSRWDQEDKSSSRRSDQRDNNDKNDRNHHSNSKYSRNEDDKNSSRSRLETRESLRKTSGPKTPPDVLSRRNKSVVSDPPTPTMDEVGDNYSHDLSLMNVSASSSRRPLTNPGVPDWVTAHKPVATNSLQRPNLRVINTSNGTSITNNSQISSVPSAPGSFLSQIQQTVVSQQQYSSEITRSQSQNALQQLLKNAMSVGILNKSAVSANLESPDDNDPVSFDAAPFSPTDSPDMESPQEKPDSKEKSSLQSKVDKLLILAKSSSTTGNSISAASLFKKPSPVKMSKEERRRKVKESLKKKLAEDESGSQVNKKEEKVSTWIL